MKDTSLVSVSDTGLEFSEKDVQSCLEIQAGDGPSKVLMKRIAHFRERPPGSNWDGAFGLLIRSNEQESAILLLPRSFSVVGHWLPNRTLQLLSKKHTPLALMPDMTVLGRRDRDAQELALLAK